MFMRWMTVLGLCCVSALRAGEPASPGRDVRFGLLWENDAPAFKPEHSTDRFYTNGTAIFVAGRPQFVQGVDLVPFWDADADRYALGFNVGQLIFTPGNLTLTAFNPRDHPYGGYCYGGLYWQRQKNGVATNIDTFDHLQLDLGIVGPSSRAELAQETVHDVIGSDEPRGWDNQIHDEFTAQLDYRKKWRLTTEALRDTVDLIPSAGFSLGSVHRRIEGGATLRVGCHLPDDFGPARIGDLGAATGSRREGWSFYGFARAAARIVEYNIFLNGNNFRDSPGVGIEHLVGECQFGVNLAYHWTHAAFEAGYSQTFITPEFKDQDTTHGYGAWTFTMVLEF